MMILTGHARILLKNSYLKTRLWKCRRVHVLPQNNTGIPTHIIETYEKSLRVSLPNYWQNEQLLNSRMGSSYLLLYGRLIKMKRLFFLLGKGLADLLQGSSSNKTETWCNRVRVSPLILPHSYLIHSEVVSESVRRLLPRRSFHRVAFIKTI